MFDPSKIHLNGCIPDKNIHHVSRGKYRGQEELTFAGTFLPNVKRHYPGINRANTGTIDMRSASPSRYRQNQGSVGCCVLAALIRAIEIQRALRRRPHVDLSILAAYYQCRQLMNPPEIEKDAGTYIWLAVEVLKRFGVVEETYWPFDANNLLHHPPDNMWEVMQRSSLVKIKAGYRITSNGEERVADVIEALELGHPVIYGTAVGPQWTAYYGSQSHTPLLPVDPAQKLGNHATVLLGWDGNNFLGENSWGRSWGEDGFYSMAPEVIADHIHDPWIITTGFESYEESNP